MRHIRSKQNILLPHEPFIGINFYYSAATSRASDSAAFLNEPVQSSSINYERFTCPCSCHFYRDTPQYLKKKPKKQRRWWMKKSYLNRMQYGVKLKGAMRHDTIEDTLKFKQFYINDKYRI